MIYNNDFYTYDNMYDIIKKFLLNSGQAFDGHTITDYYIKHSTCVCGKYKDIYVVDLNKSRSRIFVIDELIKSSIYSRFIDMFKYGKDNICIYAEDLINAFYRNGSVCYIIDLIMFTQQVLSNDISSGSICDDDKKRCNKILSTYDKLIQKLVQLCKPTEPQKRIIKLYKIVIKFLKYTNSINFSKNVAIDNFLLYMINAHSLDDNLLNMFGYRLIDVLHDDKQHIVGVYKEHNFSYIDNFNEAYEKVCRKGFRDFYDFCN